MKGLKIAKTGMRETVTCKECGETEELCWVPRVNEKLKAESLCFTCDHWSHFVESDPSDPNALVIKGRHFIVGDEEYGGTSLSGFAGQRFTIEKVSGERLVTTNLWTQGEIPERFRDRLLDNAKFIGK